MEFKKIILMLVLILCVGFILPVYASDINDKEAYQSHNQLRWANTDSVDIMLDKTSSGLEACVVIIPDNNESVDGKLYLQKYKYGYWITVKAWKFSDKGFTEVNETYRTSSGKYRAKVKVKVGSDSITMYSFEKEIN